MLVLKEVQVENMEVFHNIGTLNTARVRNSLNPLLIWVINQDGKVNTSSLQTLAEDKVSINKLEENHQMLPELKLLLTGEIKVNGTESLKETTLELTTLPNGRTIDQVMSNGEFALMTVQDFTLTITWLLITGVSTEEDAETKLLACLPDGTTLKLNSSTLVVVPTLPSSTNHLTLTTNGPSQLHTTCHEETWLTDKLYYLRTLTHSHISIK